MSFLLFCYCEKLFHLYYFVLEHITLWEFGWVHYGLSKREIESTTRQICDYTLKNESKSIYEGAGFRKILGNEEWKQR